MNKQRLRKLAEGIIDPNNYKDGYKFDFQWYIRYPTRKHPCGTSACAIGMCPIIFPKLWRYKSFAANTIVHIKDHKTTGSSIMSFFDIEYDTSYFLFTPDVSYQNELITVREGQEYEFLGEDATSQQVSDRILKFIKEN